MMSQALAARPPSTLVVRSAAEDGRTCRPPEPKFSKMKSSASSATLRSMRERSTARRVNAVPSCRRQDARRGEARGTPTCPTERLPWRPLGLSPARPTRGAGGFQHREPTRPIPPGPLRRLYMVASAPTGWTLPQPSGENASERPRRSPDALSTQASARTLRAAGRGCSPSATSSAHSATARTRARRAASWVGVA